MKKILTAVALVLGMAAPAMAAEVTANEWVRDDGASRIKFEPCAALLCGSISWLRTEGGAAYVGQPVFFDMKQTSDTTWEGQAFNPEDGKTYTGKMTLNGDTLITEGCVFFICKAATWLRV
jgi:uncharacterized protein (DUF2147 family)